MFGEFRVRQLWLPRLRRAYRPRQRLDAAHHLPRGVLHLRQRVALAAATEAGQVQARVAGLLVVDGVERRLRVALLRVGHRDLPGRPVPPAVDALTKQSNF